MPFSTILRWVFVLGLPLIAACGPATRQERAVEHAERNTAAAERNAQEADEDVENSRAAEDVLGENDPAAVAEANRILEETPEEDPNE
jgi:hypothetical protein